MPVEIFYDVLCPWCYVGKRRLDEALARRPAKLRWRAFNLIPGARREPAGTVPEAMAAYLAPEQVPGRIAVIHATGAELGLDIDLPGTRQVTSFDAHRLLKLAADHGRMDAVMDAMYRAHFTEHRVISDPAVLAELGADTGLDRAEVARVLNSMEYTDEVLADFHRAAEAGVRMVPSIIAGSGGPQPLLRPVEVLAGAAKN
ncbi:DsbA family oxidoreductase [Amycolatopsis sp. cmx-11-51]|uniref:DsbA family oxidoreductase n=1 Tax=Amycolatopsis sp. cmx-11-51 TaxID=2785797 RepID=UPI0039E48FC9